MKIPFDTLDRMGARHRFQRLHAGWLSVSRLPTTAPAPEVGVNGLVTTNPACNTTISSWAAARLRELGDTVLVHYTGWLQNADGSRGSKFDSSRDRGQPLPFTLGQGQVIKGWEEGVRGMKVGGQRRLIIPSVLGYGARGAAGGMIRRTRR